MRLDENLSTKSASLPNIRKYSAKDSSYHARMHKQTDLVTKKTASVLSLNCVYFKSISFVALPVTFLWRLSYFSWVTSRCSLEISVVSWAGQVAAPEHWKIHYYKHTTKKALGIEHKPPLTAKKPDQSVSKIRIMVQIIPRDASILSQDVSWLTVLKNSLKFANNFTDRSCLRTTMHKN